MRRTVCRCRSGRVFDGRAFMTGSRPSPARPAGARRRRCRRSRAAAQVALRARDDLGSLIAGARRAGTPRSSSSPGCRSRTAGRGRRWACTGCGLPSAGGGPSTVRTVRPWPGRRSTLQLLTALPSRRTVHAMHCPVSQPTWVPGQRERPRSSSTSSVCGLDVDWTGVSLTVRRSGIGMRSPRGRGLDRSQLSVRCAGTARRAGQDGRFVRRCLMSSPST